jgi:hypothetical protein
LQHNPAAGLAGALVALALPWTGALAQSNPVARGSDTSLRVSLANRQPLAVVERVLTSTTPFNDACGDRQGTLYSGAEVEPHLAVNPLNPDNVVGAWQQDRYGNGGARGVASGASFDGGLTWTRDALPVATCAGGPYARATDPWLAFAPDGTAYQIALGFTGDSLEPGSANAVLVARSADGGRTWGAPQVIASSGPEGFNDKETLTADPLDSRFVYAVWDRLIGGGNSAMMFVRTTDAGATWEPARSLYVPTQGGETIGHAIRVLPDGALVDVFMQLSGQNTVYVMRSGDRGLTWSAPIKVATSSAMGAEDPHTGAVIRDASILPQMAVAPDGTLYVVWQDARFTGQRDAIALARSTDGGLTWSAPVRVNSDPNVAAFIPQVHVRADGVIGVTYYDLRSNTADPATLPADFWLARSSDGVNWSETRISPAFDLATAPKAGGLFLGDYTGLASAGTTFIALYAKTTGNVTDNRTDVFLARIGGPSAAVDAKRVLAEEAALPTYRAQPLPDWQLGEDFRRAVAANTARAREQRYLKVQRYTASSPGR